MFGAFLSYIGEKTQLPAHPIGESSVYVWVAKRTSGGDTIIVSWEVCEGQNE